MKKRDKFWLNRFLFLLMIILVFMGLSLYNIVQFNNSYLKDEFREIDIFKKQIKWVVIPYLKNGDFKELNRYCEEFKTQDDIAFKILNSKKEVIANASAIEHEATGKNLYGFLEENYSKWKIYRNSLKAKKMYDRSEFTVNNQKYYLELMFSQKTVISAIINAQRNLFIFFIVSISIISFCSAHIFYQLRKSFNKLEDDVTEIANGNLETPIDIPKIGLLEEITLSIKKMTFQLKKQIEDLTKLEQYKSYFLQGVSHEIKTPITAINSAIELLETRNSINNRDRECFDIILFQTKAINKLVNDILQLSELESQQAKQYIMFHKFNLNSVIKDTINSLRTNNVEINLKENDDIEINSNRDLINVAISNLVVNSLKYSKTDKIDIIISKVNNFAQIEVKDYGIGIDEIHQDKIFDRFYRVDKARSRQTGGTGLGLSIVKSIVELHQGTINLKSKQGEGCNFIINLPL